MKLVAVRHLWGVNDPWETALPRFAKLGYSAIEMPLPPAGERGRFVGLLKDNGLAYVPMAFTGAWGKEVGVAEHVASLREQVATAKSIGKEVPVLHLTVHSGRDWFTLKEAVAYFTAAAEVEAGEGLALAHETHRGRVMFNPWRTAEVLEAVPATRLCCDYSHWVVVCERLITDCEPILKACAEHCLHLHTRVGYGQGPQVPDPAAAEYKGALETHEGWWRLIWESQKRRGFEQTTFTPEFGPPEYLHTLPHTNVPVADLQVVCEWMARRIKETYTGWSA